MYIIGEWNERIWVSTLVKSEKREKHKRLIKFVKNVRQKGFFKIGSIKPLEIRKRNFSLVSNSKNSEKGSEQCTERTMTF